MNENKEVKLFGLQMSNAILVTLITTAIASIWGLAHLYEEHNNTIREQKSLYYSFYDFKKEVTGNFSEMKLQIDANSERQARQQMHFEDTVNQNFMQIRDQLNKLSAQKGK